MCSITSSNKMMKVVDLNTLFEETLKELGRLSNLPNLSLTLPHLSKGLSGDFL